SGRSGERFDMAPARVRGCVGRLLLAEAPRRQADASRRLNGPRKATCRRPITVRLRRKTCLGEGPDALRAGRRGVVAITRTLRPRDPRQADVGTKTRSAGRVPFSRSRSGGFREYEGMGQQGVSRIR